MTLGRPQAGNLQLYDMQFCPPSAAAAAREACVHRRSCQVTWQAQGQLICLPELILHFRHQYPHEELKCSDCKVFAGQCCLQTPKLHSQVIIRTSVKGNQAPHPFCKHQNISVNVIIFYVPSLTSTSPKPENTMNTNTTKRQNYQSCLCKQKCQKV